MQCLHCIANWTLPTFVAPTRCNDDDDDHNEDEDGDGDDNDGKCNDNDDDDNVIVNLMLPTFVAPTATIAKYPKAHFPSSTTRSFKAKRPCSASVQFQNIVKS